MLQFCMLYCTTLNIFQYFLLFSKNWHYRIFYILVIVSLYFTSKTVHEKNYVLLFRLHEAILEWIQRTICYYNTNIILKREHQNIWKPQYWRVERLKMRNLDRFRNVEHRNFQKLYWTTLRWLHTLFIYGDWALVIAPANLCTRMLNHWSCVDKKTAWPSENSPI